MSTGEEREWEREREKERERERERMSTVCELTKREGRINVCVAVSVWLCVHG